MKSVILLTVSVMACLLPILSVEGQQQAAWKVSRDGRTRNLVFITDNGLAWNLPLSLLQQLPTGNKSAGHKWFFSSGGEMNFGNAVTPSAAIIIDSKTLASHSDKFNGTMALLTATETIPENTTDTTTDTIPETTTEIMPATTETITDIMPAATETITEIMPATTEIMPATTEIIPASTETTNEIIPVTTKITTKTMPQTSTETITETTTDTNIGSTTATTATDDRSGPPNTDVGSDGLLYFKSFLRLSLTNCRTYCHGFRGFRLAIAKTNETMDALRTHGNVMIDMTISRDMKTGEVQFIWGDGTELDKSLTRQDLEEPVLNGGKTTSVIIMYKHGPNVLLDDAPSSYSLPCLCQRTPEIFLHN